MKKPFSLQYNLRFILHNLINYRHFPVTFLLVGSLLFELNAQNRDVPFVPTPHETVEEMLNLANVGPGDYVIDLGSGDGRIVIAAAKRGAYGHGVDIDPRRISEARKNAIKQGVDDKVLFIEGNLFETDFSKATVITMYLLNSVNMKLRPYMLDNLKPGTRVVSYYFNMNDWQPDKQVVVNNSDVYFWIIPAKAGGQWKWTNNNQNFDLKVTQTFQNITLELNTDNTTLQVSNPSLSGEKIWFTAENPVDKTRFIYHGRINGKSITGTAQIRNGENSSIETWNALLQ